MAAGLRYAFSCTNGDLSGATYAGSSTSATTSCTFGDNGTFPVKGRIIDKDGGFTQYTTNVIVNNVAPSVPMLLAPADGLETNDGTPTFDWSDSTDPAGANDTINYVLLADNSGCCFPSPEVNEMSLSASTFTPATDLA